MRRFIVNVLALTGMFCLLLWATLALPPFFGCLAYSDRPGTGCPGFATGFPLGQLLIHATKMVAWAVFGTLYYWMPALLAATAGALTQRWVRNTWLRGISIGAVTLLPLTYLTQAIAWYFALAFWAVVVIGLGGAILASWWVLARYPSAVKNSVCVET